MDLTKLSTAIAPSEVEWRVGNQTKDGKKIMVLAYIDNRAVMKRLDEAFGPLGWSSDFKEVSDGFLCTITVWDSEGRIIHKTDGAPRRDTEPLKSALSDAMKRAAVHLGIGRELYSYPKVYIETTNKYLPDWSFGLLDKLVEKISSGGQVRDMVLLKEEHARK